MTIKKPKKEINKGKTLGRLGIHYRTAEYDNEYATPFGLEIRSRECWTVHENERFRISFAIGTLVVHMWYVRKTMKLDHNRLFPQDARSVPHIPEEETPNE